MISANAPCVVRMLPANLAGRLSASWTLSSSIAHIVTTVATYNQSTQTSLHTYKLAATNLHTSSYLT